MGALLFWGMLGIPTLYLLERVIDSQAGEKRLDQNHPAFSVTSRRFPSMMSPSV